MANLTRPSLYRYSLGSGGEKMRINTASPDRIYAGQEHIQPQVKLGIINQKRLLYITLNTVRCLAVLARQVNGPVDDLYSMPTREVGRLHNPEAITGLY